MAPALELMKGAEPIPGYRLEKFLGRGGWGEVWLAFRPDGRDLALKFLPCDSYQVSQEIRALQGIRQLKHPNLIRIDQVWSCSGYLVIGMEMAEGSLLDLLSVYQQELQSAIFPEHACYFLNQTALVLDFLNARQHQVNGQRVAFRHCDVKPSNILLQGRNVKLADFSLVVQTTSTLWNHRKIGTVDYAGPEVFQGTLSDRTDQYALAVTYCQLRGGIMPFDDTPSTFLSTYVRPTPNLSMLTPAERPIISRGLAPIPHDRWQSCTEMMKRLTECQAPVLAAR